MAASLLLGRVCHPGGAALTRRRALTGRFGSFALGDKPRFSRGRCQVVRAELHSRQIALPSNREGSTFSVLRQFLSRIAPIPIAVAVLSSGPPSLGAALEPLPQAGQTDDLRSVRPGETLEREIAGGEVHAYGVPLALGEFARVVVYQRGIDLVVAVIDPGGQTQGEFDTPNGWYGVEEVSLLAKSDDTYRVEVRSLDKEAARGLYEIRLEIRRGTPEDRDRIASQKAYADGEKLRLEGTAESHRRAIEKYEKALALRRSTMDRRLEAITLLAIGEVYLSLGERRTALDYYQRAASIVRPLGDPSDIGGVLNYIGVAHYWLGENQKALDFHLEELGLHRSVGSRGNEANALSNIGRVYHALGESRRALEFFREALSLRQAIGDRFGLGHTLTNMGQAYLALGDHQKALAHAREALPLRRAIEDRRGEAMTLNVIGEVHGAMGEKENALEYFGQALSLWRTAGDRSGEAETLSQIGNLYALFGERQKALDHYHLSLAIRRSVGDRSGEAQTLYSIARAERERGNLLASQKQIEAALAIFETLRISVRAPELRVSYFASLHGSYEFATDLLMQLHRREPTEGYEAAALRASENARARGLLELLGEAGTIVREGIDPVLLGREQSLRERLTAKLDAHVKLLSGNYSERDADAAAKEIEVLKIEYEHVNAQIRSASPRYASLTQPQPKTLSEIQKEVLDPDTLLLEYAVGQERSYLWLVSSQAVWVYELPGRSVLEPAARSFHSMLAARNQPAKFETLAERRARIARSDAEVVEVAAALSRILLGPVAARLERKRLLIVPDGALQYIPFAALPVAIGGRLVPLVVEHEVVTLPSASALAVLRRELTGRAPPSKTIAVFADPVFGPGDERLKVPPAESGTASKHTVAGGDALYPKGLIRLAGQPLETEEGREIRLPRLVSTAREAKAILALVPENQSMQAVGFQASLEAVSSADLRKYRYVHFATHGFLNSAHPELSGIVLSLVGPDGKPREGYLSALEAFNLKLSADLVVLSGCQTGLGKEVRGEGLVGLTRGFMYAGAARVVVSLWDVPEEATAELMARFYKGMLRGGLRPAEALRAAQISIWKEKRWQHPYYWAAFIMQGEPR